MLECESLYKRTLWLQVLNGEGYGIVVRCGDETFIGHINALTARTKSSTTTLQRDMTRFVRFIAIIAVTMAIILFSVGLGRGMSFAAAFVNGLVVVIVANIPQGLPATVTSMLVLTANRMRSLNVLVKKTDIIETLGSASRICSDKTGTLTQNKMTVMNVWVNRQFKSAADLANSVPLARHSAASAHLARSSRLKQKSTISRASAIKEHDSYDIEASAGSMSAQQSVPEGRKMAAMADLQRRSLARVSSAVGSDMLSRMSAGVAQRQLTRGSTVPPPALHSLRICQACLPV